MAMAMATAPLTVAQAELINSLSQDDIPIKLRCAICSKLAVNAFRLPCCEQAICETCQSTLPSSCPVCEHTPVAAEDCKPNKSLRTTIKVFLRTEEKKREALRLKDLKNTPPDTPATPVTPVEAVTASALSLESATTIAPDSQDVEPQQLMVKSLAVVDRIEQVPTEEAAVTELPTEAQQDIPQPSIEEIAPGQETTEEGEGTSKEAGDGIVQAGIGPQDQDGSTEKDANGQPPGITEMQQPFSFGMGYGFDGTATASFPNMGLLGQGADFNQMQMMMAMQNGMAPNAFGSFPMMGMSGVSMDPMAMQNMYMNGGFGVQGMGMNGMNMGMGMAGYDGGVGAGFNNGWNGQQSWNIGQDNFNHPNAAGMGHGDYGTNNTGFHAAGYNQGNYGRSNQYNDYQQNGYGHQNQGNFFRGRGRGRGYGYGQNRGGHAYGQNEPYSQNHSQAGIAQASAGPMSDRDSIPTGPKFDMANAQPASNVDEFGREIRQSSEAKVADEVTESKPSDDADAVAPDTKQAAHQDPNQEVEEKPEVPENSKDNVPKPIQTLEQIESISSLPPQIPLPNNFASLSTPNLPSGPSSRGQAIARAGFHSAYHDRIGPGSMQPPSITVAPKVLDIPVNAPTGPKAMREGLPNTSLVNLRGRGGFPLIGRGGIRQTVSQVEANSGSVRSRSESPQKERNREENGEMNRERSRSPSDAREKERERHSDRHRKRRYRSTTESEDEQDEEGQSERYRRRHRHRSTSLSENEESRKERRRRRKYDEDLNNTEKDPELAGEDKKMVNEDVERSRSQSPAESRRSSHRSRRDRDRDRDRDRERERERERDRDYKSSSHKHRSSHRSHRDRSRSRDHDRDRDRDRERRHRHKHESMSPKVKEPESQTSVTQEVEKQEIKIPSGPRAMSISSAKAHTNGTTGIEIKGASTRRRSVQVQAAFGEERMKYSSQSHNASNSTNAATDGRKGKDRDRDPDRVKDISTSDRRTSRDHSRRNDEPRSASSTKLPDVTTSSAMQAIDPHTLEREARNRERLLKEAQRIAGLAAAATGGRKRSRDDGGAVGADEARAGGGRVAAVRKYRRGEREGDEERIARLESEREAGRWG